MESQCEILKKKFQSICICSFAQLNIIKSKRKSLCERFFIKVRLAKRSMLKTLIKLEHYKFIEGIFRLAQQLEME
jgi:hypothetical protein